MEVSIKLDTAYIGKMFVELKRHLKVNLEDIVHAEASSIAKQCALWQKERRSQRLAKKYVINREWTRHIANFKTDAGKVAIRVAKNSGQGRSEISYGRGAVFFRHPFVKKGKSPVNLLFMGYTGKPSIKTPLYGNRYSKFLWSEFKDYWQDAVANFKTESERKIANISFTRKTWIQVLLSLGYSWSQVKSIPPQKSIKIPNANTFVRGVRRNFGFSWKYSTDNNIVIKLSNQSSVTARTDNGTLERAIKSRRKAFEIALKKGVFYSEEQVMARYGWIVTL